MSEPRTHNQKLCNTEKTSPPKYLYKISSPEAWQESQETRQVKTSSLDKNFIHLAMKDQLPQIARKYWDKKDYVILKLDSKKLVGHLVFEKNPGGTTCYYHLYDGYIPLDAVLEVIRDLIP